MKLETACVCLRCLEVFEGEGLLFRCPACDYTGTLTLKRIVNPGLLRARKIIYELDDIDKEGKEVT